MALISATGALWGSHGRGPQNLGSWGALGRLGEPLAWGVGESSFMDPPSIAWGSDTVGLAAFWLCYVGGPGAKLMAG